MRVNIIAEDRFADAMRDTVLPFLDGRRQTGTFERVPGESIFYEHYEADDPAAVVVIVHGFSSSIPKFYESVWYFLQNGFSVWLIEQRGHGRSFRSTADPDLVRLSDYRDLVRDLHYFVKKVVIPANTRHLPLRLFAHSMGGAVSACLLSLYPDIFDRAVLSSPMLEINTGKIPVFASLALAEFKIRTGKGDEYMPGSAPMSDRFDFEGSLGTSRARCEWYFALQKEHPEYRMCVTSWLTAMQLFRLAREAMRKDMMKRITANVLIFQAENDTLVKPEAQKRFAEAIAHGRLIRVPGVKHEICRSDSATLAGYWVTVFSFLGQK